MSRRSRIMGTDELRARLANGKYTRWAADLTVDEMVAVFWAVGEDGRRSFCILECVDRHASETFPNNFIDGKCIDVGYLRGRLAAGQLDRMVRGERIGFDALLGEIHAVIQKWSDDFDEINDKYHEDEFN